jgi:hypothetical protein
MIAEHPARGTALLLAAFLNFDIEVNWSLAGHRCLEHVPWSLAL